MATIAKKSKSRREPESAAHALDEIQGLGDRLTDWVGQNVVLLLGAAVAILLLAGGIGLWLSSADSRALERVEALSVAEDEFRAAMGAAPGDVDIPEPANPEVAQKAREEALARFRELATAAEGSVPGSLAGLRAGDLEAHLGRPEAAIETWRSSLQGLGGSSPVRGFLLAKIAGELEELDQHREAGATYAEAAALADYPLRHAALADAARVYAQAGDADAALEAFQQLETQAPDFRVPPHVRAQLSELRARHGG